jgi:hypothetical protein
MIQAQGAVTADRFIAGQYVPPALNEEDATSASECFRISWKTALADREFVDYVRQSYPTSLEDISDFDPSADFVEDPGAKRNFLYDAVTGLGLSMCQAGQDSTFFTGAEIYEQFRNLNFEGSSGEVRISNKTGTRDHTTVSFVIWNVRVVGTDAEGYAVIEFVPSLSYEKDVWGQIPGNSFQFASEKYVGPDSLPFTQFNFNHISKSGRVAGYTLMGVAMFCSSI